MSQPLASSNLAVSATDHLELLREVWLRPLSRNQRPPLVSVVWRNWQTHRLYGRAGPPCTAPGCGFESHVGGDEMRTCIAAPSDASTASLEKRAPTTAGRRARSTR